MKLIQISGVPNLKSKLKLCQRSVRYIGYVFGVNGIHADPDKVADVHKMPAPTSPKQVRQFLGYQEVMSHHAACHACASCGVHDPQNPVDCVVNLHDLPEDH